jgi:hypothetical protein
MNRDVRRYRLLYRLVEVTEEPPVHRDETAGDARQAGKDGP